MKKKCNQKIGQPIHDKAPLLAHVEMMNGDGYTLCNVCGAEKEIGQFCGNCDGWKMD